MITTLNSAMTGSSEVVLLVSGTYLSGSSLQDVLREHQIDLGKLTVVTSSATLQSTNTPRQSFQKAISIASSQGHHTPAYLGSVATMLKPGASLLLYEPTNSTGSEAYAPLKKALLLAGFMDSTDRGIARAEQGQHVCVRFHSMLSCLRYMARHSRPH